MVIYFDLDGTILDVAERYYQAHRVILGASLFDCHTFWECKRARVSMEELLATENVAIDAQMYRNAWQDLIETREHLWSDRVHDHALVALSALRELHRLVVVTRRHRRENLEWQLAELGLTAMFAGILSVSESQPAQTKTELIARDRKTRGEANAVVA